MIGSEQVGMAARVSMLAVSTVMATAGIAAAQTCVPDPAAVIAAGQTPTVLGALPAETVAKLEAAVEGAMPYTAAPGAIAAVMTPDGVWMDAFGIADPATGAPMEPGMHTRIGSVTKTFTGTLILQLAQAGKLSLDDTIGQYVDGIPNGDVITLRQLASMTSGVQSYTKVDAWLDIFFEYPLRSWTPEQLVAFGVSESPIFEPGAAYDYSNTNTILLGMVVEQVAGLPIAEAMQTMILDPLGLENTYWPGDSTEMPEPYPQGFTLQGNAATPENPSNATHWNPSWGWTAGEMVSDIGDLLIYGRALGTGHGLLDAATQTERLTSFPEPAGYGLAAGCTAGWMGHTGELPGYNTTVFYNVASDTTVIVQANSDIPSGDCGDDEDLLPGNPTDVVCSAPASRIFSALAEALGQPFAMPAVQ
ncbi:serine hydrolase domain-containing protein [Chachezhania sediminis]|uniref:serine hydrolase domain-containing protein n=1 Tax=Chachezhania sediminis TaxID=2599291 RepID=UPI001E325569|nr:serine hydrolase domain-containing protein [Chachezhania sediminis]